jgi:hypothetical protein
MMRTPLTGTFSLLCCWNDLRSASTTSLRLSLRKRFILDPFCSNVLTILVLNVMKPTWCTFHSIYWVSKASTCFEHYLLILRRRSQTALAILRAYSYVSWLCHDCSFTAIVAQPTDIIHTKFNKCRLCSKHVRGPWFSMSWMKSASRWFHHTDTLWCTVIKTLNIGSFIQIFLFVEFV